MISLELDNNSATSLYIQLYERIKEEISGGRIGTGEKLPSLRGMASNLGVSVTTVKLAYDQLIAEGYLVSRPQSGYYAASGAGSPAANGTEDSAADRSYEAEASAKSAQAADGCDPDTFDFVKWKKCMASVLNDSPEQLLTGADRQGEPELRE